MRLTDRRMWSGLCFVLILSVSIAAAQSSTGRIVGAAADSSGAFLPGVTVTVIGPALIREQTTATASDGAYRFSTLPPGEYSLTFELASFQTVKREGVRVEAGQTYAVDVQMQPARVEESVTVVAGAPLIDVRAAQVGHTVTDEVIQTLPISRRFSDVLNTLPGVTDGLYTFSPVNTVYGSSVRENVYMVDGLNFVDPLVGTPVTDVPYDDIEEARVTTAGFSAAYGQASGGIFNFVTKSGGNAFQGIGNYHFQNKSLQSNNITDDLRRQGVTAGTTTDHVYDWGGNIGGPIVTSRLHFSKAITNSIKHNLAPTSRHRLPSISGKRCRRLRPAERTSSHRGVVFPPRARFPAVQCRLFDGAKSGFVNEIGWKNNATGFGWNATLGNATLLDVHGGFTRFTLTPGNPNVVQGVPSIQDAATGLIVSGTTNNQGENQRDNYEWKAEVSHYRDQLMHGSHNFRAGFHWSELRASTMFADPRARTTRSCWCLTPHHTECESGIRHSSSGWGSDASQATLRTSGRSARALRSRQACGSRTRTGFFPRRSS